MNRKIKYILILILAFLIILLFAKSLVIGLSKSGKVSDSVTKKPLEGVYLLHQTNLITPGFEGSHEIRLRSDIAVTDKNGYFSFPFFMKFKLPFGVSSRELLYVNYYSDAYDENDNFLGLKYNSIYMSYILGLGLPNNDNLLMNQQKRENIQIYLSPIVKNLSDCKEENVCLIENKELLLNCNTTPYPEPGSDIRCKNF